MRKGALWKISVTTSPEAEKAVGHLLETIFGQPASIFLDATSRATVVSVYAEKIIAPPTVAPVSKPAVSRVLKPADAPKMCQRLGLQSAADLKIGYTAGLKSGATAFGTSPRQQFREVAARLRQELRRLAECGLAISPGRISVEKLRRGDWGESWERHFRPIEIGSALLLKPSWSRTKPKKTQAEVVLDPGLSFGTGQHPTTRFCLEQIVAFHSPNKPQSFLDLGTGSGILAIAAAKLGYRPVLALDVDPQAIRTARANARRNGAVRIACG